MGENRSLEARSIVINLIDRLNEGFNILSIDLVRNDHRLYSEVREYNTMWSFEQSPKSDRIDVRHSMAPKCCIKSAFQTNATLES